MKSLTTQNPFFHLFPECLPTLTESFRGTFRMFLYGMFVIYSNQIPKIKELICFITSFYKDVVHNVIHFATLCLIPIPFYVNIRN